MTSADHWHNSGCADVSAGATGLFAETWFHRDPFAPLGAPAGNNLLAALGLHARAKSVCLRSLAPVGLECTLGHEKYLLLIRSTVLGQTVSINQPVQYLQTAIGKIRAPSERPPDFTKDTKSHEGSSQNDKESFVNLRALRGGRFSFHQRAACTFPAAVTIAALDSIMPSGSE
jgi:hypothetical protein